MRFSLGMLLYLNVPARRLLPLVGAAALLESCVVAMPQEPPVATSPSPAPSQTLEIRIVPIEPVGLVGIESVPDLPEMPPVHATDGFGLTKSN